MKRKKFSVDSVFQNQETARLFEGEFGFEKENIRVTKEGYLALTPHPANLGDKLTHPYFTTDFSESQVEMITPVRHSVQESIGVLETLHDLVVLNLGGGELLWNQSAPPKLPEDEKEIPIARFGEVGKDKEEYRQYLANVYGRKKQMLSGVHVNFSFSEKMLHYFYEKSTVTQTVSYEQFREECYLKTTRNLIRFRWFLIGLLGNSPAVHSSYMERCVANMPPLAKDAHGFENAVSIRNGVCGYRNKTNLLLDYTGLQEYRQSLKKWVSQGSIRDEKENYSIVRLKELPKQNRINHIEVRLLDLNPFVKIGVDPVHVEIMHLFLVYCLLKEEADALGSEEQERAAQNHETVATEGLNAEVKILFDAEESKPLEQAYHFVLEEMRSHLQGILPSHYERSMAALSELVGNPETRPALRLVRKIKKEGFLNWHLSQMRTFETASRLNDFAFHGLEDMELSTQLLLREAVFRGLHFDILDRQENFVKLSRGAKTEYVKQATRTSLDTYSSVLMMENKVVTKKVLDAAGIRTPLGQEYSCKEQAEKAYEYYQNQAIVLKPKSTNFGIGITILKENNDPLVFERAVEIAFEHDKTILIEEFVRGKEYRFFVLNNEVSAVLLRVPANVEGDGKSSIRQLVEKKNRNPIRGKGYNTPLEKIRRGESEKMFLHTQGFTFDTVPQKGEVIYLRENSNISTGGDSLDFTDMVPDSYKKIALDAAKAMRVNITGLDMMIEDLNKEASANNYAIIEMNFNPAIHIHCHPYVGKNRRLNAKILDALGF